MTKQLGNHGETLIAQHLIDQGFTILARNYKKFFGEIDIIAQQKNIIAFVEVKTRKSNFVSLHELISISKQHKIIACAKAFLSTQTYQDMTYRFDVALIDASVNPAQITYIANAFTDQQY